MSKILFFVGLIAVMYIAWTISRRSQRVERQESTRKKKSANDPVCMIECPVCGTHFPEDEAVLGDGERYCSEKCRNKARRDR